MTVYAAPLSQQQLTGADVVRHLSGGLDENRTANSLRDGQ